MLAQSIKEKIPDWLTITRVVLTIPACALLLLAENNTYEVYRTAYFWSALAVCVVAGLTDFFDGYLARKWKQRNEHGEIVDKMGAKIDPVADKIFTYPVLWALSAPQWLIVFMFMRDLLVTLLRYFLENYHLEQKTSTLAKLKTSIVFLFIFVAIITRLYIPEVNIWNDWYFTHVLFVLALWTLLHYYWGGICLFFRRKSI